MLQRLLLHFLIAAVGVALLGLGSPWLGTAAADAAQVTVVSPGGAQRALALEALAGSEDVVERGYALRSSGGEETRTVTGFSMAAVMEAAGADPFGFSYLEVQRPGGGSVQLSRHQALDPGAFPDGPPVVYATASGTGFLRPSSGPGDLNASDSFEAPQGLTIVLRKGSGLQVRAEASPRRTKPGKQVHFSAVVEGGGSGEELTYSWYFGDGESAEGPSPVHSFAKPGSYEVVVGVTTPGDEVGVSAVVRIQVGQPAGGGPDRQGGGTNKSENAPDQGVAEGPSGAGSEAPGIPAVPSSTDVPAEPAPAAPPLSPEPQPEPAQTAPEPSGDLVSGLLIGNSSPAEPSPETEEQQAAARTGTPSADEAGGGGGGLPGAAVSLLITAGLLGAGALVEARNLVR
jgi:PKD domain-containing protein